MTDPLITDLVRSLDPASLCAAIGMVPDPWQLDVLRDRDPNHQRQIWITSRQAGKSTVMSLLAAWELLYGPPGSLTIICSPSQRQSTETLKKVQVAVRAITGQARVEGETVQSITMQGTGNRCVSLPGTESGTLRGFSAPRQILLDEASRIPSDLYYALRPMLAVSGGKLIAASTPAGRRGWLWDAWSGGEPWFRVSITADMVPRISAAFLDEERAALGPLFEQEYMGQWLQDDTQFFSSAFVASILKRPDGAPPPGAEAA